MTTVVHARSGGRPVMVVRPDASSPGSIALDLLSTANRARAQRGAMCVLPLPAAAGPLRELLVEDVPQVPPGPWLRAQWAGADVVGRGSDRLAAARAQFWHEWHREIRRHAGDQRLPPALRARLREHAQRVSCRPAARRRAAAVARPWLRDPVRTSLPPAVAADAAAAAAAAGIVAGRDTVAVDVRARPDLIGLAAGWLAARGYQVVQVGPAGERIPHPAIVDARSGTIMPTALTLHVLLASRFVICDTLDTQRVAYLTGTPALLLNAIEPLGAYPIRSDGLFTMATPVDLDTGAELDPLSPGQDPRAHRACGFRVNTAGQIRDAVGEMHDATLGTVTEHDSQLRFRARVLAISRDERFVAAGRLARWQAERVDTPVR